MLTVERLKELLHYDPETGIWTWLVRRGKASPGKTAGSLESGGYVQIEIDGVPYLGHRLAWFYMKGRWPPRRLDHKDLVRDNNRWKNLRLATHRQNLANAKVKRNSGTGAKGVQKDGRCNSFVATITFRGKREYLGSFGTVEEASAAYVARAKELHGRFARAA